MITEQSYSWNYRIAETEDRSAWSLVEAHYRNGLLIGVDYTVNILGDTAEDAFAALEQAYLDARDLPSLSQEEIQRAVTIAAVVRL